MKDMEQGMVEKTLQESRAIASMKNNVGLVLKAVPPGLWTKKINEVGKFFENQDPATAMVFSGLNRSYLEERNALTGAAASEQEDAFIKNSMPNPDDDFKTFMAKAWIYQKMREYQYARRLNELSLVRNMRGMKVPPMPPEPWTQYRNVNDAIRELEAAYAGGGGPTGPAAELSKPQGAGPGFKPVQRRVEGF